jgi:hypothetical protein
MKKLLISLLLMCVSVVAQVPPSKVVIVALENTPYSSVTTASMPYVKSKAKMTLTGMYGTTHPSIGNYFSVTLGQIITNSDGSTTTRTEDNIVRKMIAAGKTYKSYAESLPSAGYTGSDVYPYVLHHNPLAYLSDVRNDSNKANVLVPFTQFATDVANNNLPDYSFIVPNMYHNAHDCPQGTSSCTLTQKLQAADTWIKNNLAGLLASPDFQAGGNGVLIFWFDESSSSDTTNGGGHIYTALTGPAVKSGTVSTTYKHYNLLRTIDEMLGITSHPGNAATVSTMAGLFNTTTPPPPTCATDPNNTASQVVICNPPNGSTQPTSFHIIAAASASAGIKYMQIYLDGVKYSDYFSSSIDVPVTLATGARRITVQAADNNSVTFKTTVNVTVQ